MKNINIQPVKDWDVKFVFYKKTIQFAIFLVKKQILTFSLIFFFKNKYVETRSFTSF